MLQGYHIGLQGVFLTLKDVRCKIDTQRLLVDITAYQLLERDLFDDTIIGHLYVIGLFQPWRNCRVPSLREFGKSKRSKIAWTSSHSRDFLSMISRKWDARSRPVRTHVGFPIDWMTAISSITITLPKRRDWCSSLSEDLWGSKFSKILINLLLPMQWLRLPSELNSPLGNVDNSNSLMISLRSILGLERTTTGKRAKRALSSLRAATSAVVLLFLVDLAVFHVCRLTFFIGLRTLSSRSTILPFTNFEKSS